MKRVLSIPAALLLILCLSAFPGCKTTLHKPTTVGNTGTAALVAYSVSGQVVSKYLSLPLCSTTVPMPCKTQDVNDKLAAADTAAYNAAVAADQAANAGNAEVQAKAVQAKADLDKLANSRQIAVAVSGGAQ